MPEFSDFIFVRQAEMTRLLAGCALVRPAKVMELIAGLSLDDLRDTDARRFLLALKDEIDPIIIAEDLGLEVPSLVWLGMTCLVENTLEEFAVYCVHEIKRLAITLDSINRLIPWIGQIKANYEWRYVQ